MKFHAIKPSGEILNKLFETKSVTDAMNTAYWLGVNFVKDSKSQDTLVMFHGETIARIDHEDN